MIKSVKPADTFPEKAQLGQRSQGKKQLQFPAMKHMKIKLASINTIRSRQATIALDITASFDEICYKNKEKSNRKHMFRRISFLQCRSPLLTCSCAGSVVELWLSELAPSLGVRGVLLWVGVLWKSSGLSVMLRRSLFQDWPLSMDALPSSSSSGGLLQCKQTRGNLGLVFVQILKK